MTTQHSELETLNKMAAALLPESEVKCDDDGGFHIVRQGRVLSSHNMTSLAVKGFFEGAAAGLTLGERGLRVQAEFFRSRLPVFAGAYLKDLSNGDPNASSLDFMFNNLDIFAFLCSTEDEASHQENVATCDVVAKEEKDK